MYRDTQNIELDASTILKDLAILTGSIQVQVINLYIINFSLEEFISYLRLRLLYYILNLRVP